MFCREQVARLSQRSEEIRATGAEIVAVGNGRAQWLQGFLEEQEPDYPVYTDPARSSFGAFEMKRSGASLLNPKTLLAGARALSKGHMQTRTRGDAFQLGGVIVVAAGGEVVYEHIEDHPGDLADLDEVIAAAARRKRSMRSRQAL